MAKIIGSVESTQSTDNTTSIESPRIQEARAIEEKTKSDLIAQPIRAISPLFEGQPGRVKAEQNIASRVPAMDTLKAELNYNPDLKGDMGKKILKNTVTGLKVLNLVDERVQGAIASPMLELMDPFRKDIMQDTALAIIQGVSGKRPARYEDVITAKLPELKIGGYDIRTPVSIIGGLAADMTMGAGIIKSAKGVLQGGPQTIKSIQKSLDLAHEVKSAAGKEISNLFSGPVGSKAVDPKIVNRIVSSLPEGVFERIVSKPKVYDVAVDVIKDNGGKIIGQIPKNDAKNVWNLRKAIDDLLTSSDFAGKSTTIAKDKIINAGNELRGVLAGVDKEIAPVMDKFSEYAQTLSNAADYLTNRKGNVVANKAASILKRTGEPGAQLELEKFAQLFPRGAKMLQDIKILNRNRAVTAASMFAVKSAVAGAIFSKFIKPTTTIISGGSELDNTTG